MSLIENSSVKNNNNVYLEKLINYDIQQKSGLKNTFNAKIGCFILSVQKNIDSISEMVYRKKIIRSYHSAIEAIEFKSASNDISKESLKKIERKITEMNRNYSFLDTVDIKEAIKFKTRSASKPVQDKISAMLDHKFGIDIYHNEVNLNTEVKLTENKKETGLIDTNMLCEKTQPDTPEIDFISSVKNHKLIKVKQQKRVLSEYNNPLPSIEESDTKEDSENNLLSLKKDIKEITESLSTLKMEFKLRGNKLSLHDAYKVNKHSFN